MQKTRDEQPTTPPRIDLEGTENVRDIGGYLNVRGERVRRGVFYRADNLGRLSRRGREQARGLDLDAVIDLRSVDELRRYPNVFADPPEEEPRYLHFDVIGDIEPLVSRGDTIELKRLSERDETGAFLRPVERLTAGYGAILDERQEIFRELFETLGRVNGRPIMYHCVAGQDRTGLVTALLLSIAEVPAETIAFDYGETAVYNIHRFRRDNNAERWGLPVHTEEEYRRQLCPPEAMRGTLEHLERSYGGPVEYLLQAGVPQQVLDRLRTALL